MTVDGFSELVQSQDNSEAPGGRGEYYLKRPNVSTILGRGVII